MLFGKILFYSETDRADVFVEEGEIKCLVNSRARSAGHYSRPAPMLARMGTLSMHINNPRDKNRVTV